MSKVEFSEICFLFTPIRRYFFFFLSSGPEGPSYVFEIGSAKETARD